MIKKIINPNEYGSLYFDNREKEYLGNVIDQKRIFRYSKCNYPYTEMCEEKIGRLLGTKYNLLTTSGTSALKSALVGAGVVENDRVLISAYTFLATALAPISLGAIPIPIEIDLDTGLNLDDLEEQIKKGCKAVIAVHFQGMTFDLSNVKMICKKYNVIMIEDACQAFGSCYKSKYAGTFGDIGVYSFQQFKQITCGEGGCVVTNNEKIYNRMRNYTDMGSVRDRFPSWDSNECLFGENYRMNNLSAAVLYSQLEKLNDILIKQKKSRNNILKSLNNIKNIIKSKDINGDTGMNIVILLNKSDDKEVVVELGKEKNIELRNMWSSLYYNNNLFRSKCFTSIDLKGKECIYTKNLIEKMLVISIPPILTENNEKMIASFLNEINVKGYLS